jgi:PAS domain S-box-containing protein
MRAALLICCLVLAIIATYAYAAYRQVERSALTSAKDRLTNVSHQLASVLGASAAQLSEATGALAEDSSVAAFLGEPSAESREAALNAIRSVGGDASVAGIELRDLSGRRVLGTGAGLPVQSDALGLALTRIAQGPDTAVVGPIGAEADTLLYPVVARVSRDGRVVGYLVRWTRVQIAGVIGSGSRLLFANAGGAVWTSRGERVAAPPMDAGAAQGVVTYERSDGGKVLAAASPVAGTPWTVVIEFSRDVVLSAPRGMVLWLIVFGLVLLAVGAAMAWVMSGRLTGSVVELAESAKAISAGDYSHRTAVRGAGEVGTLGRAFNDMAENVAEAHRELKGKVDELAASEAQHRQTRERLEHVISSSRAVLYRFHIGDEETRLDWIAGNVTRLLGYGVEDALQPGWMERGQHPEDQEAIEKARERLKEVGDATQEYRFRAADGEYVWLRDEQRLLRDASGEAAEVIGALTDVTEYRHLAMAKQVAEAANQAKSEFLSRMSHELRTPLNAVLGFGQILEMDVESEENRESVEQILRAARHLLALINEVLDIARIEAGQMSLSVEPVSVASVLGESVDLVRPTAARNGIVVRAPEVLQSKLFVRADQQRLKQVLLNLLSNAIKYNRPGGMVEVSCEPVGEDRVRLVVRDTGAGLAPGKLDRLFTPFDRLGADQSGVEGTGLGLALSRGLMQAMGGGMGVESTEGEGSRFWVELPLTAPPEVTQLPEEPKPEPRGAAAAVGYTVLFVEDNLANVRLMERVFQRRPEIRLLSAMQGRLGLELAREHRPDLILLDRNLPDLPGEDVMRRMRQDELLRDIPVVMISGDAVPSQVQRMLDSGARAYITKPFDVRELLRTVDGILASARP